MDRFITWFNVIVGGGLSVGGFLSVFYGLRIGRDVETLIKVLIVSALFGAFAFYNYRCIKKENEAAAKKDK